MNRTDDVQAVRVDHADIVAADIGDIDALRRRRISDGVGRCTDLNMFDRGKRSGIIDADVVASRSQMKILR